MIQVLNMSFQAAEWPTKHIKDAQDGAFAPVEPGGVKDKEAPRFQQ
jgi:hypothetical protein